jgi:hypothetical protein
MNFKSVKLNYDRKLWGKTQVAIAVRKGIITTAEFKIITGDDYDINATAS